MNTLFDKIWDRHVVQVVEDGPTQLYIDRLYCHEVTSPQAFEGLRQRGLKCFRPDHIYCMPDHNTPTHDQDKPIEDSVSAKQVATLEQNARDFGLTYYGMMSPDNGIIHVVGPEKGLSLPGMTIVCGDSHTSTHGAMGAVAFGIGTSEVEMVMASQCILQQKPKSMRISINGQLQKGVTAKDVALYLMAQLTTSGATGYFVEYAGDVVRSLSMEGRLTLCNLSIEMGARGGMIAPDETTFEYIKGREFAPKGDDWDKAVAYWKTLKSGDDAVFDKELTFDAADIEPRITYGTNPGMGIGITESIPLTSHFSPLTSGLEKALGYMGFKAGEKLLGKPIDYVNYLQNVRGYSRHTCRAYMNDVVAFVVWLKQQRTDVRWSTITRDDVDAYVSERVRAGRKASTTNRALASISGIYNYMKRQGYDVVNPCRYESRRKIAESIPNTIPVEDLRKAYEHSYGVAKVIIGLLATTGIRVQELLNITWESIDFTQSSIHIYGKGQKERTVYTSPEYLETLRIAMQQQHRSGRIITMEQREVRWLLWNALRPWCNAKQLSPHAIRHTMATQAAVNGANVTTLAVALGHKSIRTTQKYIDMAAAPVREVFTNNNMFH